MDAEEERFTHLDDATVNGSRCVWCGDDFRSGDARVPVGRGRAITYTTEGGVLAHTGPPHHCAGHVQLVRASERVLRADALLSESEEIEIEILVRFRSGTRVLGFRGGRASPPTMITKHEIMIRRHGGHWQAQCDSCPWAGWRFRNILAADIDGMIHQHRTARKRRDR